MRHLNVGSRHRRGNVKLPDAILRVDEFHEACLIRITNGGLAIWLHPVGMLEPQVVVNLLPELGVGLDLVKHGSWLVKDPAE